MDFQSEPVPRKYPELLLDRTLAEVAAGGELGPDRMGRSGIRSERQRGKGQEILSLKPKVEVSPRPPPNFIQEGPKAERNRRKRGEREETPQMGKMKKIKATTTGSLILIHFILQNATQWKVGKLTTTTKT